MSLRCEKCGRFVSPDTCLEGWSGGLFGDYNGRFYCAPLRGCMDAAARLVGDEGAD